MFVRAEAREVLLFMMTLDMSPTYSLVVKIGSVALIRREDQDVDYNIFARLGQDLKPGMILVTSGAAEIGRLDYMKRTGRELSGDREQDKVDYAAQGHTILMANYRRFIAPEYGVRQLLLEHTHFNDPERLEHIRQMLFRAADQRTIPIINYNDPVSPEEVRKMELAVRRQGEQVVECADNDETAAVVTCLVNARMLVIMTNTEGVYQAPDDPETLVREVTAPTFPALEEKVRRLQQHCVGASRAGAKGAGAKLEYALSSVRQGAEVIIGHARHHLRDLVAGNVPCTRIGVMP